MSVVSPETRSAVAIRAGHRCEYCQIPAEGQVGTFPVDHVLPRSQGGKAELENLSLACPHCNARKWAHVQSPDSETGQLTRLFNPRADVWNEHFQWLTSLEVAGKTPIGRATVSQLQMNHAQVLLARRLLATLDLFPPRQTPTN